MHQLFHNTINAFCSTKLEEMKELQNLRKRPHGVNLVGLALGEKVTSEGEVVSVSLVDLETSIHNRHFRKTHSK